MESETTVNLPWWVTCWAGSQQQSLEADGVSYQAYYSEMGKAHHMGKDLTEVRSPQRKLVPDNVGLGEYEQTSLRAIAIKAKADGNHRFQDLYRCLNAPFLHFCWRELDKNAASGVDEMTAAAYEENLEANIQALVDRLKTNRYRAKLVRQGHYNYYSVVGNSYSLWRFYSWAVKCAFKWLNRRGGKRKSFSRAAFKRAIERLRIAKPKLPMAPQRHRVFS